MDMQTWSTCIVAVLHFITASCELNMNLACMPSMLPERQELHSDMEGSCCVMRIVL